VYQGVPTWGNSIPLADCGTHNRPCVPWSAILRRRANIAKTIEGRPLLTECRGAERRLGSPPRQFWWDQELSLEEDDDEDEDGGRGGVYPRRFYDETGQEIDPPPDATETDSAGDPEPTTPPTGRN
jgi:hypothetical protein